MNVQQRCKDTVVLAHCLSDIIEKLPVLYTKLCYRLLPGLLSVTLTAIIKDSIRLS